MKTSLCGAGLNARNLSFAEYIDLAAQNGFNGVDFGIDQAQRAVTDMGRRALEDYLNTRNVALASFGLPVEWRKDEVTYNDGVAQLAERAELAQQLGCSRCCTYILPASDLEPAEWRRQTVRRFSETARILSDFGVRLGLEWVGPHHLRAGGQNATGKNDVLIDLAQTLDLIAEIGNPAVGLLVDSYHCHTTGIGGAEVARLNDSQIVHVHLNDARTGVLPEDARDGDRLLPGEGVIDLESFLAGLRSAGYSGYVAVEVLAPQPLADTPQAAAAKQRDSLRRFGL
ncbi:MAG: sugar phosphate isomerase/epimerase family protein [Capsulimonadales bacterium]|nr:sugar phosphate isomerase/epimerase family protein [Capsulimonadales bacterium]